MTIILIALAAIILVIVQVLVLKTHPFIALLLATTFLLLATPQNARQLKLAQDAGVRATVEADGKIRAQEYLPDGVYYAIKENGLENEPVKLRLSATLQDASDDGGHLYSAINEETNSALSSADLASGENNTKWLLVDGAAHERVSASSLVDFGDRLTFGMAKTFRRLAIPVSMAAIVGLCLLRSGAAQRIVQTISGCFGKNGTNPALAASGFVLGVPVYFDNVFYLLLPLAKAIGKVKPTSFLTAVMAIIVGASMAHSLVPPTPGPLLVVAAFRELGVSVSVGQMMIGGLVVGSIAASAGYAYGRLCPNFVQIDPEQIAASESAQTKEPAEAAMPIGLAIIPIALPILLLGSMELYAYFQGFPKATQMPGIAGVIANPNVVFIATALISIAILRSRVDSKTVNQTVTKALSDSGTILLLTCAGGTFGAALQQLQLATAIAEQFSGLSSAWGVLTTAFFLTVIIRAAQGSATVAMITSAAIVAPVVQSLDLPFHPIYIALAIGCGSKPLPWLNDSGFWQVATMTGMTSVQTLKTFSVALTIMGLTGFAVVCLGAYFLPLV